MCARRGAWWWQYVDGVPSSELSYTQDASTNTTTLTVVRPVDFLVWPINMTSPTYVVFATGSGNTFSRHSTNRGVSGCVCGCSVHF